MKILIKLFFVLALISCKDVTYHSGMDKKLPKSEIVRRTGIIEKTGNITVYNTTKSDLERFNQYKELLIIAKLMSDTYNYKQATYDVYLSYKKLSDFELSGLTKNEQENALKYLLNAHNSGDQNAERDLEKYASKNIFIVNKNATFKLKNP